MGKTVDTVDNTPQTVDFTGFEASTVLQKEEKTVDMDREGKVETFLLKKVKQFRGKCYKFISPGHVGAPDRIVIMPQGKVYFVETKAPGKKPRPSQRAFHRELASVGVRVYVLDSKEAVTSFVEEVTSGEV